MRRQRGPVKGLSAHYPLRQCLQAQHSQSQQIFKFSGRKHTEHGGILGFPKEMCEIARRKILSKIPHKSAESASSKLDQCRCDFQIELATKKTERYRLKFAYHCMVHVNWESQSSGCAGGGSKVLWSIQLTAFSLFSLFPRSTFFPSRFFAGSLHGSQIFHPLNLCVLKERSHAAWRCNMAYAQFMRLSKQSVV